MTEETITKPPNRVFRSRSKGNLFENRVAKELGVWIFNDKDMLCRHLTSGAQKQVYVGDIVPQKNIPLHFNNGIMPFLIECKNGYKTNVPNLNNQTIIRQWITKALIERNANQNIIYLIVSFHSYSPLLITDIPFNLTANLILNHFENGNIIPFHIYEYRKILEKSFHELYENNEHLLNRLIKHGP